jgi:hypothetical protein
MIAMLAVFVLLYSGLLGCWAVWRAARGTTLGLGYLGGLVLLELTLLVRAGIELARLVTVSGGPHGEFGRGYAEPGVHAGYLLASIVVLPLVLTVTRTSRALTSSDGPAELGGDDQPVGRPRDQSTSLATRREATWDALVAAVGCVAVAVVTIRMGMTGRPA